MSPMRLIVLLVAAVAAIGAALMVRNLQSPATAGGVPAIPLSTPAQPELMVLAAKRELLVGQFLSLEDVTWQEWPATAPIEGFISRTVDPEALEKSIGAVVRVAMVQGEPVTAQKIVHPGQQGFMAAVLTPGMRAVSIQISAETAAGGFILPNDRVDIVLTRRGVATEGGAPAAIMTDIILENIRVLAIDGIYSTLPEGQGQVLIGSRATLELSRADGEIVMASAKAGDLSLTLRSVGDMEGKSGSTHAGRLMDGGAGGPGNVVRVFRGGAQRDATAPAG